MGLSSTVRISILFLALFFSSKNFENWKQWKYFKGKRSQNVVESTRSRIRSDAITFKFHIVKVNPIVPTPDKGQNIRSKVVLVLPNSLDHPNVPLAGTLHSSVTQLRDIKYCSPAENRRRGWCRSVQKIGGPKCEGVVNFGGAWT